jgi:hypothetical protein
MSGHLDIVQKTSSKNTALAIKVNSNVEAAGSAHAPLRDRTRAKLSWENSALL